MRIGKLNINEIPRCPRVYHSYGLDSSLVTANSDDCSEHSHTVVESRRDGRAGQAALRCPIPRSTDTNVGGYVSPFPQRRDG